jgi:hypothetical protein
LGFRIADVRYSINYKMIERHEVTRSEASALTGALTDSYNPKSKIIQEQRWNQFVKTSYSMRIIFIDYQECSIAAAWQDETQGNGG